MEAIEWCGVAVLLGGRAVQGLMAMAMVAGDVAEMVAEMAVVGSPRWPQGGRAPRAGAEVTPEAGGACTRWPGIAQRVRQWRVSRSLSPPSTSPRRQSQRLGTSSQL